MSRSENITNYSFLPNSSYNNQDDFNNLSQTLPYDNSVLIRNMNNTTFRQMFDETVANKTLKDKSIGDGLDEVFFEILQENKHSDVLNTLKSFVQACTDSLELVDSWNRSKDQNRWLLEEANTWRLLHCLYSDSLLQRNDNGVLMSIEAKLSQQKLVEDYFICNAELRFFQLLVDWLEACASYEDSALPAFGRIASTVHWENTLHHLVSGVSFFDKDRNSAMVTCMDPDAPHRQRRKIHALDQQDDVNICKHVFKEIRCGRFEQATQFCIKAGQPWRGAVLQGWRLLHYPDGEDQSVKLYTVGNKNRDLWKWCALGIVANTNENQHYRAAVGVLCGHLPSILQVCNNDWEDILWAHLKVQIELRIDKYLREDVATIDANTTPSVVLDMLQNEYQPEEHSLVQIFNSVTALIHEKPETTYQIAQRHLMLGDIGSIMEDSLRWLEQANEQLVRFTAHIILILRIMGKDPEHDVGDKILQAYVRQLINKVNVTTECPEMIAYYISKLPKAMQIELYADFMGKIELKDDRQNVINAGVRAGLDVDSAARATVRRAIASVQQKHLSNLDGESTPAERENSVINQVICTLEWVSCGDQKEDAVWLTNAMIRTFIFIGNKEAQLSALATLQKLIPSLLQDIPSTSTALREYLCLKAYLEAVEEFATWYRHFENGQPKTLEPLNSDASFTDKVHYEQKCAQISQKQARWNAAIHHQSKHTKNMLYNVLLFPGGWLVDDVNQEMNPLNINDQDLKDRQKQLQTLRMLCIPEITMLILRILQSANDIENHTEAIRLADILASENRILYSYFSKEKMREVLHRISISSLFALDHGKDNLGFDLTNGTIFNE